MAAYGKDDFVYGSDLSDFSDVSESDLDLNELSDCSFGSEDDVDDRQYCICGKASTMEMIACEEEQCEIIWWHYNCAGFTADTIPLGLLEL